MGPPLDWHPRRLAKATEWTIEVPGHPEPIAVVRLLKIEGRPAYRAVTWAPRSGGGELIGYFRTGDEAAVAVWKKYIEDSRTQNEKASRLHGGRERGGPSSGEHA